MHARIEIKYMNFNRVSKKFRLLYRFEEFKFKDAAWEDIVEFKLNECRSVKECFLAVKRNLYFLYKELEIEIPFELIEWKFQRRAKTMGVNLYE